MLTVSDLHAGYGLSEVLAGTSLEVKAGTVVALIGANGAGKTTTMRAISGMLRPTKGQVLLDGKPVQGLPASRIARLGLAHSPEGRKVFGPLSVPENLDVARRGDGRWSLERVYAVFPRLRERERSRASKLSGGEQQMLAIGRALMSNPDLLLMDEPTEGLAPLLVREVGRVIAELKRAGLSILLVEQNLPMAAAVADRVHVLNRGEIVYSGRPGELLANEDVKSRYLGVA